MTYPEVKYGAATSIGDSLRDAIVQDDPERWKQVYQEVKALPSWIRTELAAVAMAAAKDEKADATHGHVMAYRLGMDDPTQGRGANWAR